MTASHAPVTPIPALRLIPAKALAAANQQGLWLATGCVEAARLLATDSLGAWREAGSWVRNFQRNRAAPEVLRVLALKPSAVVFRLAPALGEQASSKATDLGERLAALVPLAVKGNVLAIEVVGRVDAACRLVLTLAKQRGGWLQAIIARGKSGLPASPSRCLREAQALTTWKTGLKRSSRRNWPSQQTS